MTEEEDSGQTAEDLVQADNLSARERAALKRKARMSSKQGSTDRKTYTNHKRRRKIFFEGYKNIFLQFKGYGRKGQ